MFCWMIWMYSTLAIFVALVLSLLPCTFVSSKRCYHGPILVWLLHPWVCAGRWFRIRVWIQQMAKGSHISHVRDGPVNLSINPFDSLQLFGYQGRVLTDGCKKSICERIFSCMFWFLWMISGIAYLLLPENYQTCWRQCHVSQPPKCYF